MSFPALLCGYKGFYTPRVPVLQDELEADARKNVLARKTDYAPCPPRTRSAIDGAVVLHERMFTCRLL